MIKIAKKPSKKPKTEIKKSDVKKGIAEEEKYEKIVREKVGRKMPLQAKVGFKVKDVAMKKVKKELDKDKNSKGNKKSKSKKKK